MRILVVDDSEPWRQRVCSILQTRPEFRVVAEAVDGLEAVEKAQAVNPDAILLDLGLPNLNGLEAAKRIRQLAPEAKIVFLTQNRDRDVVRAALSDGAHGYILKVDAGTELLTAVDAVVGGVYFLSSGIETDDSDKT